jgi:peptidyl-prolyl cis-trans isomerase C
VHSRPGNRVLPALLACIGFTAFINGCADSGKQGAYVARVGTAELTSDDLRYLADSSGTAGRSRREAVNEWIVNELLFQEAARRGLTASASYRRQVDDAKKRLAIAALLDQELYAPPDTVLVNDVAVDAAYAASPGEYVLHEDALLASYIVFSDRDAANAFRSAVLRGMNWNDAVREAHSDPKTAPLVLQTASRQYFTQSTTFPPELWKLARSLGREEVSFVLQTPQGYTVVKSHGLKHQGEVPDLAYVRNEIRQRLLVTERRARYDRLIENLRTKHGVELRFEQMDTSGTTQE